MELGQHRAKAISHEISENTSTGTVGLLISVQFDNGEVDRAYVNLVKKDGSGNDGGIKTVRRIFGWADDSIENLLAMTYSPIPVDVTVVMDEGRANFRPAPKISDIKALADLEAGKKIAARFASVFKTGASSLSVKPLSAQAPIPPIQTPAAATAPAPAQTQDATPTPAKKGKKEPSVATLEKFLKVFADVKDDDTRNAYFYDLIGQVLGDQFDMDKATKEQWKQVYDKIESFHKDMESQIKQLNTDMPHIPPTTEEDVFA